MITWVFPAYFFHLSQYNDLAFSMPERGVWEACLPFFISIVVFRLSCAFDIKHLMSPLNSKMDMLAPSRKDDANVSLAPEEHAGRVLRQFRLIFNTVRRHFQTMEKQSGIGGAQVWALSLVAQNPGLGVTRLSTLMDIHQSTTSNLVKTLMKSGFLHSEKSMIDRRVVELYVLPEGLKLLKKVPGPFAGVLPHALKHMDRKTLIELEQNLSALIKGLEVDENAAQTPIAMM